LVARLTGTTYQSIRELNPALRHWTTPPNYPNFELRIPKGTKARFEAEYAKIPEQERYSEKALYTRYTASRTDSQQSVARRFNISSGELAELNGLGRRERVAGKTLIVPVRQSVDFAIEGKQAQKQPEIRYYTVRKGDTLTALARRFKVSATLLASWNNLKGKMALAPGKRLIIARKAAESRIRA
jgi:membrane-bound lytic murein transglycosylase D